MKTCNFVNGEIIAVGDEILRGDTLDTNSNYLLKKLFSLGVRVSYLSAVGDNREDISNALKKAMERSEYIFLSGGLGPTEDDITRETLAEVLGLKIKADEKLIEHLKKYYESLGRKLYYSALKQTYVIEGSKILNNSVGLAPGELIETDNNKIFILPGPPKEFKAIVEENFSNYINTKFFIEKRSLNCILLGEASTEKHIRKLNLTDENCQINTYAKSSHTEVDIICYGKNQNELKEKADNIYLKLRKEFKGYYPPDDENPSQALVRMLTENDYTISFAESMTGGLLVSQITSVSGASKVLKESFITYSDDAKIKILGVSAESIKNYKVVSPQVAKEMAYGLKNISHSDICVSVTGEAGPNPSVGKVGEVYIGIIYKDKFYDYCLNLLGNRKEIQRNSVDQILAYLIKILGGSDAN